MEQAYRACKIDPIRENVENTLPSPTSIQVTTNHGSPSAHSFPCLGKLLYNPSDAIGTLGQCRRPPSPRCYSSKHQRHEVLDVGHLRCHHRMHPPPPPCNTPRSSSPPPLSSARALPKMRRPRTSWSCSRGRGGQGHCTYRGTHCML
jgi:hypothetical protein